MARQKKSLAAAIKRVAELAGFTSNPDELSGVQQSIIAEIESTYVALWESYSWPGKSVWRDVSLNKGQRYYDWPEDLEIDSFRQVWYDRGDNSWIDLTQAQGITPDMFESYAPGVESDTIYAWDIYGDDQFEVFPTPGIQDTLKLRIHGYRKPLELIDLHTLIDLDFDMVCLQAAANLTAKSNANYSQNLQQRASTRIERMKIQGQSKKRVSFNPNATGDNGRRGPTRVVAIRSNY